MNITCFASYSAALWLLFILQRTHQRRYNTDGGHRRDPRLPSPPGIIVTSIIDYRFLCVVSRTVSFFVTVRQTSLYEEDDINDTKKQRPTKFIIQ
jgi:hypothetical protein